MILVPGCAKSLSLGVGREWRARCTIERCQGRIVSLTTPGVPHGRRSALPFFSSERSYRALAFDSIVPFAYNCQTCDQVAEPISLRPEKSMKAEFSESLDPSNEIRRLKRLLECTRLLNSTLDLAEL